MIIYWLMIFDWWIHCDLNVCQVLTYVSDNRTRLTMNHRTSIEPYSTWYANEASSKMMLNRAGISTVSMIFNVNATLNVIIELKNWNSDHFRALNSEISSLRWIISCNWWRRSNKWQFQHVFPITKTWYWFIIKLIINLINYYLN